MTEKRAWLVLAHREQRRGRDVCTLCLRSRPSCTCHIGLLYDLISGFFRLCHHIDIQMRFHPILPRQAEDTSRGTAALIDVCIDFNLYGRAAGGDCCVRRNHCLRCNAHEVRTATTRFSAIPYVPCANSPQTCCVRID